MIRLQRFYFEDAQGQAALPPAPTTQCEKKLGRGKAIDLEVRARGKRFAVEIETGNSDAVSNVEKDLAAGVEYVLTVVTNSTAVDKIRKRLSDKGLDDPQRVRVVGVSSLA